MKVLIVNPSRFYSGYPAGGDLSHLFVLYSYLRTHCPEIEVDVLDLQRELFLPECEADVNLFMRLARAALAATGFDVVGISCWTSMHYLSSVAIAELCKELNPECTVVVGGYHPSAVPADFDYPGTPFDYVVMGEGEVAFQRIVTGQVPIERRPQIVAGVTVDIGQEALLWEEYKYLRETTQVQIWLTRGCPFSCGFCLDRNTKWRGYAPTRAVDELKRLKAAFPRLKMVSVMDPVFGLNRDWRRAFLDELIAADLDLTYWGETRVDVLDEDDFRKLGALNFQMDIGLDAVSPRLIEIMIKAKHPDKYLEAFFATDAAMNRHKIIHLIHQIFNYPGETSSTLEETISFWRRYYQEHPGTYGLCSPQAFSFFPGNEVYNRFDSYTERFGSRVLQRDWWKIARPSQLVFSRQVIPSTELAEAGQLHHHANLQAEIRQLATAAASPAVSEFIYEHMPPWPRLAVPEFRYFEDKALALGPSAHRHRRLNLQQLLTNLASGDAHACTREEAGWLERLLQDGQTVGALIEGQAVLHPDPAAGRRKIEKFLTQMVCRQFLMVAVPPPGGLLRPGANCRAVLRTSQGAMTFRLLAEEAPHTVAGFVHLARAGYYDGMIVMVARPGVLVESGWVAGQDPGPGYQLAPERTPRRHARGSLSMAPATHAARFTISRQPWPDLDETRTVFGELVDGWDVLDRLLVSDVLVSVGIEEEPAAEPMPAAAASSVD